MEIAYLSRWKATKDHSDIFRIALAGFVDVTYLFFARMSP